MFGKKIQDFICTRLRPAENRIGLAIDLQIRVSVERRLVHRSSNAVFCGTTIRASLVKYGFLWNKDSCIARQMRFSVERKLVHRSSNTVSCRTKTRASLVKYGFLWNEDSCIARQIRFYAERRLVQIKSRRAL